MVLTSATMTHPARALRDVEWGFTAETDEHEVHSLHPYPAKFVPALPREIILRLSKPGDVVVDPFCGSGTTLVEALLLNRRAVGNDLNPVALTASRAKTTRLDARQVTEIASLEASLSEAVDHALAGGDVVLPHAWDPVGGRRFRGLKFWFDREIALELAAIRKVLMTETDHSVRDVAMMCFSSIIVAVSHQDSDTRYVRRAKPVVAGDPTKLVTRRLRAARDALDSFSSQVSASAEIHACDARTINYLEPHSVRLVVTSPPYPNAWSYHLYHQNRILWLDADPWEFKASEIGSHRAYSAKGGSDGADFEDDMQRTFSALAPALRGDAHVVVVVGDSLVRGDVVRNDETVSAAAEREGLRLAARFNRVIDPRRKAFNPAIGKIRTEHILVFDASS